jgi:hypothetical protein
MILKASTRGDAVALARYLLNDHKNEQIEIHSVEGFAATDVLGAMREAQAISSSVKSRQYLFSVSLSPPPQEKVDVGVFENAIREIKEKNGLAGQPHISLFHENGGRRHCHLVVSRIDIETMTVKPLPFYKQKLREVSKGIYVERGWDMPRGFVDKRERDPRNFDLAEWQQHKRMGRDLKHQKMLAQEAWALSDNRDAFAQALEARGLYLARGDRRSHVAMNWQGEVLSIPKLLGRKTKEVRDRLGPSDTLKGVDETRQHIRETVEPMLRRLVGEAEQIKSREIAPLEQRRNTLNESHTNERQRLITALEARQAEENRLRIERLRGGILGLWDRVSGERARIIHRNQMEALLGMQRDRQRRDALIAVQLEERRQLQQEIAQTQHRHEQRLDALHRDLAQQRQPQAQVEPQRQAQIPAQQQVQTQPERKAERPTDQFRDAASRDAERMHQREQRRLPQNPERDRSRDRDAGFEYEP